MICFESVEKSYLGFTIPIYLGKRKDANMEGNHKKLGTEDTMDTGKDDKSGEQEWQWCLVGNIVREHELGFLDG